jgi:hypothetical protein
MLLTVSDDTDWISYSVRRTTPGGCPSDWALLGLETSTSRWRFVLGDLSVELDQEEGA